MLMLRANTAVDVLIGPFLDSTDGNTEETGLTIAQANVLLSKNGQALTQKNDDTSASHDSAGYYNCELDATDTNTEGQLVLEVHVAGALAVRHEYNVLSEAAWDSLFVAKDDGYMDVNIKTIGRADTQETEANNLESACANYSATRGLAGTALPAAAADAAGGLPISDDGGLDLDTLLSTLTNETYGLSAIETLVDELETRLTAARAGYIDNLSAGAVALASDLATVAGYLDTEVAAILEDTGTTIPAQISGLNNLSSAQAQAAATAALNAYDPPTKTEMDAGHALLATAASIAALNNISTAQVLEQATAALEATITEPADLSDKSVKGILHHLFSRFFNRNTQTASEQITYKTDGTTPLATRAASDDGTTQTLGAAE